MFRSWFALTMLAIESNEVVGLRLTKIAGGEGKRPWMKQAP